MHRVGCEPGQTAAITAAGKGVKHTWGITTCLFGRVYTVHALLA